MSDSAISNFCIGIDLGTTNSVIAFAPIQEEEPLIAVLPIPQLIAPGTIERRLTLPSFLYLAPSLDDPALSVPGIRNSTGIAGEFARQIASEQPDRVVAASKSWLCHSRVDRQSSLLPWEAGSDVPKVSPVAAATAYLSHLIDAWHLQFPDEPFASQKVALTVPASFDLVARELTRQAATAAGFPADFVFLEEPQAALYNWIHAHGQNWRNSLRENDVLLVCDVGGGTTDLTLVQVQSDQGELTMNRLAVGNHLLIGGDNMDLTLAHVAAGLFAAKGTKLNAWQSVSLWHSCRLAKEAMLKSHGAKDSYPLTILGRGSKLIGGTLSVDLPKELVEATLVDGFFPVVEQREHPTLEQESGFQELGLPFEPDTAVTRHIASFLSNHLHEAKSADGRALEVTHLLFNGGVFNADAFRSRVIQCLKKWNNESREPLLLGGVEDLDQAVACGAAHYLWTKLHGGLRIRGGTSRSYYIGIESSGPSIPGMPRPLQALCVVHQGMEEGTQTDVVSREVGLKVGQKAKFRFFSSTMRKQDKPGVFLRTWDDDELLESAPMQLQLDASEGEQIIPVRFQSRITELGVFELWCKSTRSDQSWKLELNVRE
jgi:hypothetical protein